MVLALIVLVALVGAGNFYISKRLYQSISYFHSKLPEWSQWVYFILFTLILAGGFFKTSLSLSPGATHLLGVVSGYCMGIFVYLLLFFLIADCLMLIARLFQKNRNPVARKPRAVAGVLAIVVALSFCLYGFIHVKNVKVTPYEIAIDHASLEEELNLVLVSDLHMGSVGWEERLLNTVSTINAQEPDVICIAGDIFDSDFTAIKNPENAKTLLRGLRAKYGVYACLGNHDAGKTLPQMLELLQECNITLLDEKAVTINGQITLAGRLDSSPIEENGEEFTRKETKEFLASIDTNLPLVVMDHNPDNGEDYPENTVDLLLSGHTHKGQIFPANLFTKLIYTCDYGYYRENEDHPHHIITSGAGVWGMPMRVGTDTEIVTVKLTNKMPEEKDK